jgi:hypothetical protein
MSFEGPILEDGYDDFFLIFIKSFVTKNHGLDPDSVNPCL